ncbi:hypothetical protein CC2G_011842 [Coprinopsis cinerea AmutBmut pab1-1]|nr:hypothetical protein CC2G_011842 [Coprinopsis cinerea AmutBmut pab1-1]
MSSHGTNGTRPALVPTNNVLTLDGVTVRARIDPTLTVEDVVKQLCGSLKIAEPPSHFALRDHSGELVTNENLRRKIQNKVDLKFVHAPAREAKVIAEKLREWNNDDSTDLRLTVFSLQKYMKEEQFANEFLNNNGLSYLVRVIETASGNTLAYALTSLQNLMEFEYGWSTLDDEFILRVVRILSSSQSPLNVCRPATAILKKLVEADPSSAPGTLASSSRNPPTIPPGSVYRYGFSVVFEQMRKEKNFLETVVNRLGSADTVMTQHSMMLINSLLSHASDARWDEFINELERLNVRKAVVRLMSLHELEDLISCILDFQANIVRVTHRKKTTPVDPDLCADHYDALEEIWEASKLQEEFDEEGYPLKWRRLGFETEDVAEEFRDVGVLGLECLRKFVSSGGADFSMLLLEQLSRPIEKRCPIARASNEVVELLSEHWAIFAPGYSTSTTFQPFFLDFQKVHSLATHFFIRMWAESGAATEDFVRVVALVRSQVKVALRSENARQWHEVEADFNSEYQKVRDRQMEELEQEDDLLSKVPVRNLRAKLYKESYEFVREQRIQCLLQGAWFVNAVPAGTPREAMRKPARPWRFMRLDNALKYLHYVDSAVKFPVRNGLEDLPDRIDVSMINEIATGTCCAPPGIIRDTDVPGGSTQPSPLSFSLLSAHEGSMADQIAPDQSRWADWTDGLNMLRRDGGHVASKETAGFVHALTEIGLKIKLLDLSGEMVEIPNNLPTGQPPASTDFFFADI